MALRPPGRAPMPGQGPSGKVDAKGKKTGIPQFDVSYQCMEALKTDSKNRTDAQVRCIFELTSRLKQVSDLPELVQMELSRVVGYEKNDAGQIVFSQGDRATAFYFILKGSVDVKIRKGFGEAPETVSTIIAGQGFGELALVNDKPRAATIVATTPCDFLRIDREDYAVLKGQKPQIKFLQLAVLQSGEYFGERPMVLAPSLDGVYDFSVLSYGVVQCYALTKLDFTRYVTGKTLEILKKYARQFPIDEEIVAQYFKQKEWDEYKNNVVKQVVTDKKLNRELAFFQ